MAPDSKTAVHSLMVLGHGSGSNMHVPFIAGLNNALMRAGVGTFRYEFPYSERDDFVPYSDIEMDEPEVLLATVRAAIAAAAAAAPDLPLFAGGHSVSGQMTSVADSESPLPKVRGVVLLGFPLKGRSDLVLIILHRHQKQGSEQRYLCWNSRFLKCHRKR